MHVGQHLLLVTAVVGGSCHSVASFEVPALNFSFLKQIQHLQDLELPRGLLLFLTVFLPLFLLFHYLNAFLRFGGKLLDALLNMAFNMVIFTPLSQ